MSNDNKPHFFAQDESSHWYMIPADQRIRWQQLNNQRPEIEGWDEEDYNSAIDDEFGDYRTGGGIAHIEFIPTENTKL